MSERVQLTVDDGIATITFHRPERRNAMDEGMWQGLADQVAAAAELAPRALIVTGTGGHFCAGMDLSPDNPLLARVGPAIANHDEEAAKEVITWLKSTVSGLTTFPAPTIAAIEGGCVGGGCEVALACDLRVASTAAFFSLPEVRIGMVPDIGGTSRLTFLVGAGRAARMILAAERFSAEEAHHWGLVDTLADDEALPRALTMAKEIAKGGPHSVQAALSVIRGAANRTLDETLTSETHAGAQALASGEPFEGIQAFAEKRDPNWGSQT